jgi:decaprenylphospho-beta-D-erythro-pentofuranosid-2-ulose 2-reductase
MSDHILIIGGASDIGLALAHRYARAGAVLHLAARDTSRIKADRDDLVTRYQTTVELHEIDLLNTNALEAFCSGFFPVPDVVISVVGLLGDQTENETDTEKATRVIRSNFEAPALTIGLFANKMESRGSGIIIGISSVAGDRGRATNYVYGSAKAGFTAFLSGLRNRLAKKGVHVLTVKPGFVATRMTEGMDLPARLTATPEAVAEDIWKAAAARRNVLYTKNIWWLVMMIIRNIPERVFKMMRI